MFILKNLQLLQVYWKRGSQKNICIAVVHELLPPSNRHSLSSGVSALEHINYSCFKTTWRWNNPTSEKSSFSAFVNCLIFILSSIWETLVSCLPKSDSYLVPVQSASSKTKQNNSVCLLKGSQLAKI